MNLLGAIGVYCFFAVKPKVNFDFKVPQSDGQPVLWKESCPGKISDDQQLADR